MPTRMTFNGVSKLTCMMFDDRAHDVRMGFMSS